MSAAVMQLPTQLTLEAAWDRYVALVSAQNDDAALRVRVEHHMEIARAWQVWRDLFLEYDRVSR